MENHLKTMVSVDFFTVPTIRFQVLHICLVLAHDRRRILHFAVTPPPTAEWTAQELGEAFPWGHSRRIVPITRSIYPSCRAARAAPSYFLNAQLFHLLGEIGTDDAIAVAQ